MLRFAFLWALATVSPAALAHGGDIVTLPVVIVAAVMGTIAAIVAARYRIRPAIVLAAAIIAEILLAWGLIVSMKAPSAEWNEQVFQFMFHAAWFIAFVGGVPTAGVFFIVYRFARP